MNNESIIAIIRIVLPCILSVCGILGITSIAGIDLSTVSTEGIVSTVAILLGAFGSLYTGWKNNNVTEAAQKGQMVTDAIKAGYDEE